MTENDKMEELSVKYVEVIANFAGYFNQSGRDYGTDLTIRKAIKSPNRGRYLTTGKAIDIQLKSVFKRNLKYNKKFVTYEMEVKNYNDLVERKQANGDFIPLYLIVFVVPNRINDWVLLSKNDMLVRECAYYYEIDNTAVLSENKTTKNIHIPLTNLVDLSLFDNIFKKLD